MGIVQVNQDRRMAVFEDAYTLWTERRLTQAETAPLLGVCDRTFRRQVERFESDGYRGASGPAGVAPGGDGGRGDAHGGPLPDAARGLERQALLRLHAAGSAHERVPGAVRFDGHRPPGKL